MTQIGCAFWLVLLVALAGFGAAEGLRPGAGVLVGLAWGFATWLAAMAGYLCALSIADVRRARSRDLIGVPRGVVPAIWLLFVAVAVIAAALGRRLFGGGT